MKKFYTVRLSHGVAAIEGEGMIMTFAVTEDDRKGAGKRKLYGIGLDLWLEMPGELWSTNWRRKKLPEEWNNRIIAALLAGEIREV